MNKLMEIAKKVSHGAKEHSPLILTSLGVVGLVGTAYTAYKASKKVEVITADLEEKREIEEKVQTYQAAIQEGIKLTNDDYEEHQELMKAYEPVNRWEVVRDLTGAVALPVVLGLGSIACITTSYRILTNRNSVLASTLAVAINQHKKYRERVTDEYGEEAEARLSTPVTRRTEEVINDNGKKVKEEFVEKMEVEDLNGKWFDESEEYTDDYSYNRRYIETKIKTLEDKLFRDGWVQMNDVFDEFGFARTASGALMGWSTENGLHIDHRTTKGRDPETGAISSHLYVHWNEPKYVYGEIGLYGKAPK